MVSLKVVSFILLTFLLTFLPSISCGQDRDKQQVLFIGNSLTYYSNMEDYLQNMLSSTNKNIHVELCVFPGMALEDHLNNIITSRTKDRIYTRIKTADEITETEKILKSRNWDIIIVQEGSARVFVSKLRKLSTEYSINIIKNLVSNSPKIILFKTWPPVNKYPTKYCFSAFSVKDYVNTDYKYCSELLSSTEDAFSKINDCYDSLATATNIDKISVGNVYMKSIKIAPNVVLYDEDSHPTRAGAVLNALLFYKCLTGDNYTLPIVDDYLQDQEIKYLQNLVGQYSVSSLER